MAFPASIVYKRSVPREQFQLTKEFSVLQFQIPFLAFKIEVEVTSKFEGELVHLRIEVIHHKTLSLILGVILFAVFFSNFDTAQLLLFSGVISPTLFYLINKYVINAAYRKLGIAKDADNSEIIPRQFEIDQCPACGAPRSETDKNCRNCGLRF